MRAPGCAPLLYQLSRVHAVDAKHLQLSLPRSWRQRRDHARVLILKEASHGTGEDEQRRASVSEDERFHVPLQVRGCSSCDVRDSCRRRIVPELAGFRREQASCLDRVHNHRPTTLKLLTMPFTALWEFQVKPERISAFEEIYGPDGSWAQLFRSSPDYLGTELIRDFDRPGRYLTLDHWISRAASSPVQAGSPRRIRRVRQTMREPDGEGSVSRGF